jgi:hypothetical protein
MAINLSDNIYTSAPKPTDSRYLCNLTPYTSVGQANSNITGGVGGVRYTGLTVNIGGSEYWYKTGIGDGDLVLKSLGGTITGATNGLSLYNSGKSLGLGGSIITGTTLTLSVGSTLTFVDSRFASNQIGVTYAGDYSLNYIARSIVDAGYVTGKSNQVNVYCQAVTAVYVATCSNDFIGAQSGSTICLPVTPKPCQRITITDVSGHALECMIIVNGNGRCINCADCATVNTDFGSVTLVNNGNSWSATAFIN